MKDPLSYQSESQAEQAIDPAAPFARSSAHLSLKEIVMLACIVAGAYVIAANFGDTTPWGKLNADSPSGQTFCSDEELRNMRGGHDACFDRSTLRQTDSGHTPPLPTMTNS